MRTLEEIEADLDRIQEQYLDAEENALQMSLELKFSHLLDEATDVDGKMRRAAGVTITNWTREEEE